MLKAELKAWKVLHGAAVVVIVAIVLVMRLFWGDAFNNENVKQAICKDSRKRIWCGHGIHQPDAYCCQQADFQVQSIAKGHCIG